MNTNVEVCDLCIAQIEADKNGTPRPIHSHAPNLALPGETRLPKDSE